MNKVILHVGPITFEAEAADQKHAFEFIAETQDLFGERCCGKCGSENIRFEFREDKDGHKYYKMRCHACQAQFEYGQNKSGGTLFAKRWDKENRRPMPHGGWFHWQAEDHEHPAARQHQPPATQGRTGPPQGGSGKAPTQANEWRDDLKPRAYEFLKTNANIASFNKFYLALAGEDGSFPKVPPQEQGALTDAIHKFAQARNWYYDGNGYSETPATMNDVPF